LTQETSGQKESVIRVSILNIILIVFGISMENADN